MLPKGVPAGRWGIQYTCPSTGSAPCCLLLIFVTKTEWRTSSEYLVSSLLCRSTASSEAWSILHRLNMTDGGRYIEEPCYNHCCRVKAISITYSQCVFVASIIQHAMRTRCVISAAITALRNIFTFSHKWRDFQERKLSENKIYVFWISVQICPETVLILRIIKRDMIVYVHGSSCKVSLFLLEFNLKAPCVLYIGQAFRYSPENDFYIFNQQIYFIIWYFPDRASFI